MATSNTLYADHTAGADLSTKEYAFGKVAAGGIVACSVAGERADCVIANAPTAGQACSMAMGGTVLVKVGAAPIADGAEITTNASGLAITAVATNIVRAKALEAGAVGATIRALWVDAYAKA